MRGLAPELTEAVETLIAGGAKSKTNRPPPPMFTPITLRGLTIPNRIAMSPMCMYNAIDKDGTVGDFHLVHYGSRAVGGAGLIITEMTDVSPEGRISAYCAGMYKPEHVAAGGASPTSSTRRSQRRSASSSAMPAARAASAALGPRRARRARSGRRSRRRPSRSPRTACPRAR